MFNKYGLIVLMLFSLSAQAAGETCQYYNIYYQSTQGENLYTYTLTPKNMGPSAKWWIKQVTPYEASTNINVSSLGGFTLDVAKLNTHGNYEYARCKYKVTGPNMMFEKQESIYGGSKIKCQALNLKVDFDNGVCKIGFPSS